MGTALGIKHTLIQLKTLAVLHQQVRTGVILKRKYGYNERWHRDPKAFENDIYDWVDHTDSQKAADLKLILRENIPGLGHKGEIVTVKRAVSFDILLPSGFAVYASPENIKKYSIVRKEEAQQSPTGQMTLRALAGACIPVPMNPNIEWTLEKTHLKVACRRVGLTLTEDSITLPEQPVKLPGEVNFYVTVNKLEKTELKALVYHHYKDALQAAKYMTDIPQSVEFPKQSLLDVVIEMVMKEKSSKNDLK